MEREQERMRMGGMGRGQKGSREGTGTKEGTGSEDVKGREGNGNGIGNRKLEGTG